MIAFATNLLTTSQRNPSRFLEPAVRAGVVKPRQPLCDLNPFDSVFLILRRVGVGTGPSCPEGRILGTHLASLCLTRPLRKAYSCSVKVPQRWQRNERSHWEYRRLWVD